MSNDKTMRKKPTKKQSAGLSQREDEPDGQGNLINYTKIPLVSWSSGFYFCSSKLYDGLPFPLSCPACLGKDCVYEPVSKHYGSTRIRRGQGEQGN